MEEQKAKRKRHRNSISMSQACYARLASAAVERGCSMASIVEDALTAVFTGAVVRDKEGNEYRLPYKETGDGA